jgi:segregation and condensation protein B
MELKHILESVLFSAQEPLSLKDLREVLKTAAESSPEAGPFKKISAEEIGAALETLKAEHESAGRTYRLACVAERWQFVTEPVYAPWVKALVGERARPARLSQPALETLAIIAYRQPITRAEVEQVRGVSIDGVLQTLLERNLVEQVGIAEVIGRPKTYGTTQIFLEYFGLRNLDDLPAADELRRIPIAKPEALVTVDPGLATATPDTLQPPAEGTREEAPANAPVEEPATKPGPA